MKSRRNRLTEHVACVGYIRIVYIVLIRKPEGKRPFERCNCRWEVNIKMISNKIEGHGLDSSG
jgi:hypothetical protein